MNDQEIRAKIQETCLAMDATEPLTSLQGIINEAVRMLKEYGVEYRPDIEEWANTAVAALVEAIPNFIVRKIVGRYAPVLIDAALDKVFGPDND